MKTLDEIKQILSDRKSWLFETYQITELGIFDSYARGEQTQDSDVDVLIDYKQAPTLFELVNPRDFLRDLVDDLRKAIAVHPLLSLVVDP